MLLKKDFWRLLVVCLKMLFRKSTRKRFICLVAAFLFTVKINPRGSSQKIISNSRALFLNISRKASSDFK